MNTLLLYPYLSAAITKNRTVDQLLWMGAGVFFLALMARVAIPLPFTPVPITGQSFGVLLLGLLYGRKLGLQTIGAYLLAGSCGFSVFSLGTAGFPFFSPSGGYLLGYVGAVWLCGGLAEKGWTQSSVKMAGAMLFAQVSIYGLGLLQLSLFVPSQHLLAAGFYPFIVGDLIKMALVVVALPSLWRLHK